MLDFLDEPDYELVSELDEYIKQWLNERGVKL
jgi:hypothetical protein